jgi:chorismate mutase
MTISPLNSWLPCVDKFPVIAGPCGAESEEQLRAIASQLQKIPQVVLFRSGVWKPRTRPNSFEGKGEEALKWLNEVKREYLLPVTVEVANAAHVELALKYGVDVLWIGARTTVNPFSVQEIADALKGSNVPVMIKNPIHPDLQLWLGAIERVYNAGIHQLAAIHRGFHYYGESKYRNQPLWKIPIELRTVLPQIPIICDPSHISGKRLLVGEVAQEALNLGMDGLMIETHHRPDEALSDAAQQITPADLASLLVSLKMRTSSAPENENKRILNELRKVIDELDEELLNIIKQRQEVILKIGTYKKDHDITVFQLERWQEILKTRAQWADKHQISRAHVEKLCQLLHEESIRIQNDLLS